MTPATQTIPDMAQSTAASALQKLLPELVALTIHAKQAHWNVTGPMFLPLHALTDELASDTRVWADRVAERAVALDFPVDARPATVAAAAGPFPAGRITDHEVIGELVDAIDGVVDTARYVLNTLESSDAVGHDVTVGILQGLEKYRWMLQAQRI